MVGAGTGTASEELALEDALEDAESVHEPVEGPEGPCGAPADVAVR